MTMPNFIVIGATKSGTTSLWHYLNQHPQVYMSPKKEPHFFAFGNAIPSYVGPRDVARMRHQAVTGIDNYQKLFSRGANHPARGEASAMYLYMPQAPSEIYKHLPQAKLIAILRNPVERAYSAYLHHVRDGVETLSFEEAIEMDRRGERDDWMPLWHYWKMGLYYQQLRRYYDRFTADQLRVYLYDDLCKKPREVFADIFDFLGVDAAANTFPQQRYNASGIPKSARLHRFLTTPSPLKTLIRRTVPQRIFYSTVNLIKSKNFKRPSSMPSQLRAELLQQYREDVLLVQELLDRDLGCWLRTDEPQAQLPTMESPLA